MHYEIPDGLGIIVEPSRNEGGRMRDYIELGPTPADEECAQLGSENYEDKAREECKRHIERIKEVCGKEPKRAHLGIKSFEHDFGIYFEVVCYYDDDNEEATEYALKCEGEGPTTWK
jgi:hypothetical protein